jgi:hypothetical protein
MSYRTALGITSNNKNWKKERTPYIYNQNRELLAVGPETKVKAELYKWIARTIREFNGQPINSGLSMQSVVNYTDSAIPFQGYYFFSTHVWKSDKFVEQMQEDMRIETINRIYKGLK